MGYRRRTPAPYMGPWWDRDRYLKKMDAERRAKFEEREVKPKYEALPYVPQRVPTQVNHTHYRPLTQFRIHAFNVASVVLGYSGAFSEEIIARAQEFSESAKEIGSRKGIEGPIQLLDRGRPLFMVDGELPIEEAREKRNEYYDFVRRAKREALAAVTSGKAEIPLRNFIDFWDPQQRTVIGDFAKRNAKVIGLLEVGANFPQKAYLDQMVAFFSGSAPKSRQVGLYVEASPRDLTLEEYRGGMEGLEELRKYITEHPSSYAQKNIAEQVRFFRNAYLVLKKGLMGGARN